MVTSTINLALKSLDKREFALSGPSFLQQLLLFTDGRITDIIQAYSGETVSAVKLSQEMTSLTQPLPVLKLVHEERVLRREILLQGEVSKKNLLYADSILVPERLGKEMRDDLLMSNKPIGKLLKNYQVETFRKVLNYGIEEAGRIAKYFQIDETENVFFRTYLVFIGRSPAMMITEKFPTNYFAD